MHVLNILSLGCNAFLAGLLIGLIVLLLVKRRDYLTYKEGNAMWNDLRTTFRNTAQNGGHFLVNVNGTTYPFGVRLDLIEPATKKVM